MNTHELVWREKSRGLQLYITRLNLAPPLAIQQHFRPYSTRPAKLSREPEPSTREIHHHLFLSYPYEAPSTTPSQHPRPTHLRQRPPFQENSKATMAQEGEPSRAPSSAKPAKHIIDNNDNYIISVYDPLPAEPPESVSWDIDRGEETGSDEQVYCWGGPSEQQYCYDAPSEQSESDGGEVVDYPSDPDEVSGGDEMSGHDELSDTNEPLGHDELSNHDALSDTNELSNPNGSSNSKNSSASDNPSNTNKQSDSDLAFEVAYEYLRSLPVTASSGDAGVAEREDRESTTTSNMITSLQSDCAPVPEPEHASAGDQQSKKTAESAVSEIQQRRLARRLKREPNLPVPDLRGDASKAEVDLGKSAIASSTAERLQRSSALLDEHAGAGDQQSEGARAGGQQRRVKTKQDHLSIRSAKDLETREAVSDLDTKRSSLKAMLAARALKKELEKLRSKPGDGLGFLRPPKASWIARFAFAPFFEERDPNAKRIRFGLESGQWSIVKPDYVKLAIQFSKKYGVTGCPFGRSSRPGKVIDTIWKRAKTVDLGQPTLQPVVSLSPQQWPKPVLQPIEPPPWQSFLESMKRPVQQSVEDPLRQAVSQPDTEREQQSIQQAVQQLARLTVKDANTKSAGKPVQQPEHASPHESVEEPVQQSIEGPVKTPERSSIKTQSVKSPETPDQPPAEELVKKPRFTLLLGGKPVQEQPGEPNKQHSGKSPAQRRVERSARLNKDLVEEATPSSSGTATSQGTSQTGLAVSAITVVCDFQPTTPDISPLPPPRALSRPAPESKIVTLKLPSTSPNTPAPEPTITAALQSLTLTENANPCPLFRTLPSRSATSSTHTSSSPAQSPIPSTSSPP